ncbi:MAG: hypothetical protein CFH40_00008 [Alphaproteobacteria bacterium MarineAlpha10_Bin3]|jgi:hypothetical protein|nr:MAG: hypothetical protein CFH40_00008 [Alphaproteobacteria bacterium MarineAlpha10_Bin3]PPR75749.1 MAG: hypothetical protein CFH09_00008 [Alphaproteobacteria bacterium MarineAlpha4_Bin1]
MTDNIVLLDPTAESAPAIRQRVAPPASLDGLTIGLLDIGKARGDVFLDQLADGMTARGLTVRRYAKPTNTKVAPLPVAQAIALECDVVVEALSD